MFETILIVAVAVGAAVAALALAFVVGMRRKSRLLFVRPLICLQRTVLNPLSCAGPVNRARTPGSSATAAVHRERLHVDSGKGLGFDGDYPGSSSHYPTDRGPSGTVRTMGANSSPPAPPRS